MPKPWRKPPTSGNDHAAFFWSLHAAWRGRVFRQGEVGPRSVIVGNMLSQRTPQMRLVDDDYMIEALAANGTDQLQWTDVVPDDPTVEVGAGPSAVRSRTRSGLSFERGSAIALVFEDPG